MTKPRNIQINASDTPYYHCVSRCVRRAHLCGIDNASGKSYEHRRAWVEKRIHQLSQAYAIKVCAYAVMNNHTHLVLYIDEEQAQHWSDVQVLAHWQHIHSVNPLIRQYLSDPSSLNQHEKITISNTISVYRQRLTSISWFMRDLNEVIAKRANQEDQCTGRFWEGRFKCQALLDETAVLAAMAYVDLNPIRANLVSTPKKAKYTSIFHRIAHSKYKRQPSFLMPFLGRSKNNETTGLEFNFNDYLTLLQITQNTKTTTTSNEKTSSSTSLLARLRITHKQWVTTTRNLEQHFKGVIGQPDTLFTYLTNHNYRNLYGMRQAKRWLSAG